MTTTCPVCGTEFNAHMPLNEPGTQPEPGSVSLCNECFSVLEMTLDRVWRHLTIMEFERLPFETKQQLAQGATVVALVDGKQPHLRFREVAH
jgi:hypothetical protein